MAIEEAQLEVYAEVLAAAARYQLWLSMAILMRRASPLDQPPSIEGLFTAADKAATELTVFGGRGGLSLGAKARLLDLLEVGAIARSLSSDVDILAHQEAVSGAFAALVASAADDLHIPEFTTSPLRVIVPRRTQSQTT